MATLLSVNVGLPKNVDWQTRTVYTGVWKQSVDGPRLVRRLNIDGDGQGDLSGHGGEQRAVLVYQIESYRHWQNHFGRDDFEFGQFGENFTVTGLSDGEVCIGDRYRIGEAEFEATGPQITLVRSGLTVRWANQHRSVLELAESCDVPTRWSCRTGVCHTCVTPILSGGVSYDPKPLEMPGIDEALICCARPTSDIVVDL